MALISSKFLHGECECSVRSGIRVLRKKFDRRIKFCAVSEATLYTAVGCLFFRLAIRESLPEGAGPRKKQERDPPSIPCEWLYPDRRGRESGDSNRIVDAEKLERYFALAIHFFFTLERNLGRRTSDSAALRKPAFVSRPLNCVKKKCEREKNIFPR